jgi:membrane protease YdiL (CAAX protease family)
MTLAFLDGITENQGLGFAGTAWITLGVVLGELTGRWCLELAAGGLDSNSPVILLGSVGGLVFGRLLLGRQAIARVGPVHDVAGTAPWETVSLSLGTVLLNWILAGLLALPCLAWRPGWLGEGPAPVAQGLVASVILIPVLEELLFRGVLLRGYASRYGFPLGTLLSSGLFGLSHSGPFSAASAMLFGTLAALLYQRTGSILPCIAAHAMVNLAARVRMVWPDLWLLPPLLLLVGFLAARLGHGIRIRP